MNMKKPVVLVIMDGYAITEAGAGNAIAASETPVLDELFATCPHTELSASGEDVGLPVGQIGNSEVGHTNIGAGRIVYQDLPKITREIESGEFFDNAALLGAIEAAKKSGGKLHLMGLVSPGGVHSHIDHLFALIELARRHVISQLYIHCFMDGRDVMPDSGKASIEAVVKKCSELGVGKIATVIGRFYAMDRDNRWERVQTAYDAMVSGVGEFAPDSVTAVQKSYDAGIFDEFVKPIICDKNGMIESGDAVIFFNFRPDRAREISQMLLENLSLHFVCMTHYDDKLKNVHVAYPPDRPGDTLGEVISRAGLTQVRIAETEKYAHVTFFLNGGTEDPFDGEKRILIPSPKEFPTYDLIPEMSARAIADAAMTAIPGHDVIIINFANCDMVGHTGDFEAAVAAVQVVDECVGRVRDAVDRAGGIMLVTSDHGNAEIMLAEDGKSRHTAHSTNPVPLVALGVGNARLRAGGRLCDIAPTMLNLLGLDKPESMTGEALLQ